nr:MAG TPA: hypothetical protein [Bacteriophage sp.]
MLQKNMQEGKHSFTSHYVTINSFYRALMNDIYYQNLHPTM